MKSIIDFTLDGLKQIEPGSNNLFDKYMQIIYHETIDRELDNMTSHREEV